MSGRSDPVARLFATALLAVGALMFALCGLCSLAFAGSTIVNTVRYPSVEGLLSGFVIVAIVGGLPTFLGFVVMRSGYRWRRRLMPTLRPSAPPPD